MKFKILYATEIVVMGIGVFFLAFLFFQNPFRVEGTQSVPNVVAKTATTSPVLAQSGALSDRFCDYNTDGLGQVGSATSDSLNCGFRLLRLFPAGTADSAKTVPATTTLTFSSANDADDLYMNILMVGSSTPSKLSWKYEVSNDGSTWYGEDIYNGFTSPSTVSIANASSTSFSHSTSTAVHDWQPGTFQLSKDNPGRTATSTKSISLPKFISSAFFARIVFFIQATSTPQVGGDALSFYAEVVKKQNN